ncbi:MAG: extracellular solute-binding protein [Provencibacterium sp.]|jgi:putative aldouronate transport system substrate-binding protein|nr:extracellular solute-binding protein [Provencibacterium sp.]
MSKKLACIALSLSLILLAACGAASTEAPPSSGTAQSAPASSASAASKAAESVPADAGGGLPIVSQPLTLDYWSSFPSKNAETRKSLGEVTAYQELEKRTGITINWQHPPIGQENEQFNLMIASGDIPDMIYYNWQNAPGGPAKYIDDGLILKLNDVIEQSAPNLRAVYEQYPEAGIQSQLDDGTFYMFPFIKPDSSIRTYNGPIVRKDWLDKAGLERPVTIDDWYIMLKAFKEQDPNENGEADEIPFVSVKLNTIKWFAGAWGMKLRMDSENTGPFYQSEGKVHFGPMEDDYQEYLTVMRRWYAEGLIDPDFAATDSTRQNALISGNQAGAFWGGASGGLGKFLNSVPESVPGFDLTAVQYPAGKAGVNYNIHPDTVNSIPGTGAAITTVNKHVEETVKWFDYMYGEEGARLMNFGIEGDTYEMVNGEPIYTDVILNDPEGRSPDIMVASHTTTPQETSVYATGYYTQMLFLPQQKEALSIWGDGDFSLNLPPISYTSEESQRLATIMNEVNTYVDETFVRFIMGQEGVDDFEVFRGNLKNMNIEEAVSIAQAALERYQARA